MSAEASSGHWSPHGPAIQTRGGYTYAGGLVLDRDDNPVVGRIEVLAAGMAIPRVTRWQDGGWVDLGGRGDLAPQGASLVGLKLDSARRPTTLVLQSADGGSVARVRQWDGSAWQPVGAALGSPLANALPSGAVEIDAVDQATERRESRGLVPVDVIKRVAGIESLTPTEPDARAQSAH